MNILNQDGTSSDIYTAIRRNAYRMDQDWEDRVQDAAVWLLEHDGTKTETDDDGTEVVSPIEPDHAIALGTLHMRGRIRNGWKRKIHTSLTDEAAFAIAERATAIKPDTTRADLLERIAALKPMQQDVCRMLLAGMTQAEIAVKLQIKAATLRKRIERLRDVQ